MTARRLLEFADLMARPMAPLQTAAAVLWAMDGNALLAAIFAAFAVQAVLAVIPRKEGQ